MSVGVVCRSAFSGLPSGERLSFSSFTLDECHPFLLVFIQTWCYWPAFAMLFPATFIDLVLVIGAWC